MHKYLLFLAAMLFYSCSADNEAKAETPTMNKIYITIDGQTQSATLVDNGHLWTMMPHASWLLHFRTHP